MTIVADRGLFVRLLVQSGRFELARAEALVDTIDATTKEPATKADLDVAIAELRGDTKRLGQRVDQLERRLEHQIAASSNGLLVKLGGLMIAPVGLLFAPLRLT